MRAVAESVRPSERFFPGLNSESVGITPKSVDLVKSSIDVICRDHGDTERPPDPMWLLFTLKHYYMMNVFHEEGRGLKKQRFWAKLAIVVANGWLNWYYPKDEAIAKAAEDARGI